MKSGTADESVSRSSMRRKPTRIPLWLQTPLLVLCTPAMIALVYLSDFRDNRKYLPIFRWIWLPVIVIIYAALVAISYLDKGTTGLSLRGWIAWIGTVAWIAVGMFGIRRRFLPRSGARERVEGMMFLPCFLFGTLYAAFGH